MATGQTRRRVLLGAAATVVLGAIGFGIYRTAVAQGQPDEQDQLQTTTVRQGDLTLYASGTGTLIAGNQVSLGFGTSGIVAELYVQVGQDVQQGDLLAVEGDREQLEASLASDQLALLGAQEELDALYADADLVAAQAQLALAEAQEALEDAQRAWQYQQAGYRASSVTIKAAEAELAVAQSRMESAKGEYDSLSGAPSDDPRKAQAYKDYAAAYQRYQSALATLNWYTGHPSETQQAQLDADLALAKAQLAEADRDYERVKDGPDPNEIAMAELQLTNARAKLAVSQRNLDESRILAPMSGTILEVSAGVGDTASGAFIVLADLKQLEVQFFLDETDLDKVRVGYEAEVTFDAFPDLIFTGQVTQVDPSLYSSGQFSAVRGLIQLDPVDASISERLLLGMNAAVDVIGGRAEGVAIIPVEALRELSAGEYAVFVMQDGEPRLRPVEVGLMDFSFVEVKSGLEIGDVVTTGIVETD